MRIIRLTHEDPIYLDFLTWLNTCATRDQTRSERISSSLRTEAVFKILQLVSITIIAIYLFGLLWYRFSLSWQRKLLPEDNEHFYFVNRFGNFEENFDSFAGVSKNIVTLMYFMLTTLSTVGYGDFFPSSIMEKLVGIFIEIVGVTIFSILMN